MGEERFIRSAFATLENNNSNVCDIFLKYILRKVVWKLINKCSETESIGLFKLYIAKAEMYSLCELTHLRIETKQFLLLCKIVCYFKQVYSLRS